jgi:predicted ester cyclase
LLALAAIACGLAGVSRSPETRAPITPRPSYRPQRITVAGPGRRQYIAACIAAGAGFAIAGLLSGMSGTFLHTVLGRNSPALAGLAIFIAFAAAAAAQIATRHWSPRHGFCLAIPLLVTGAGLLFLLAWLRVANLGLFLVASALAGIGIGAMGRAALRLLLTVTPASERAERVAGLFLFGYLALSVPVIGIGVALQSLSFRVTIAGFVAVVIATTLAVAPLLLQASTEDDASEVATDKPETARTRGLSLTASMTSTTTRKEHDMTTPNRDSLANGLVTIGEEAVAKSNDALFYDYFTDDYILHSPAGEFDREDLRAYFAALRESFTNYTISRAQLLVDGNFVTARTVMAGRFDKEFAYTPIGTVPPNGKQIEWELINIFRYTDDGHLVEEWVQTDTYDFLRQLGAVE